MGDSGTGVLLSSYDALIVDTPTEERSRAERPLGPAVATLAVLKLVVNTAVRFVYPFLPAISRGLGINLNQAGLLVSVRWAASLTTPVIMTVSSETQRSRRVLVSGLLIFATGAVVTAWTSVYIGAIVGFALLGLSKPLVDISAQVYVSERVPYRRRARYLGILEISWAGGLLVGAPLAGWLISNVGWEMPFWVIGSLGLLCIGAVMLYLDDHDEAVSVLTGKAADSPGRQVLMFLGTVALFSFAHESVLVVLGSWLEGSFGLTLLALGGVGTIVGLSELAGEGAMVSFTDRLGKRNSVALGFVIACVSLLALTWFVSDLVPGISALVVTTAAIEFGYISSIPLATELRPRDRSRLLAWLVVANGLGRIVGDIVAPRVFTAGTMRAVTLMAAAALLGSLVILFTGVREVGSEVDQPLR